MVNAVYGIVRNLFLDKGNTHDASEDAIAKSKVLDLDTVRIVRYGKKGGNLLRRL